MQALLVSATAFGLYFYRVDIPALFTLLFYLAAKISGFKHKMPTGPATVLYEFLSIISFGGMIHGFKYKFLHPLFSDISVSFEHCIEFCV